MSNARHTPEVMSKYTVSSGGNSAVIEAVGAFDAAKEFVRAERPKVLGALIKIVPDGEDDDSDNAFFCLTEKVCKELGVWGEQ